MANKKIRTEVESSPVEANVLLEMSTSPMVKTWGGILSIVVLVAILLTSVGRKPELVPGDGFWATVATAAHKIADPLTSVAGTILGVGTATMAFLQAFKDLFKMRARYNRWAVKRWMGRRLSDHEVRTNSAVQSLESLATGGEPDALYSLEIDKLADQMAIAGRMALDRSQDHNDFLICLLREAPDEDRKIVLGMTDVTKGATFLEAKARTTTYIQRAIDGFRNGTGYEYALYNQWAVFLVNLLLFILLWCFWSGVNEHFLSAVGAALLSAFIAPIAKDLITGLQSLKDIKK